MDVVVDFVAFEIEGVVLNIKEFCIIRLENDRIKDFKYGTIRPVYGWHQLSREAQRRYEFLYREYGINYNKGNSRLIDVKKSLEKNLNRARQIYVKNSTVKQLVLQLVKKDDNIVTLDSIGYEYDPMKPFKRCCNHANLRNRCVTQDGFSMADFVMRTIYSRTDTNVGSFDKNKYNPGKMLSRLKGYTKDQLSKLRNPKLRSTFY